MAEHGRAGAGSPLFLLRWGPPEQAGRFVVGGWCLESWRGSDCAWAMDLAGLGAYFWVDAGLAKAVAARVLRGHRVAYARWLPCGSEGPEFQVRGAHAVRGDRPAGARRATPADGPGPDRPVGRAAGSVS